MLLALNLIFIWLSSLLQDSTPSSSADSDSLFSEVCMSDKWHFNKNTPLFLRLLFDMLLLWSFSKLWQLLFMERSALLSHPPSSDSDPDDDEQVSRGQTCPSPASPGTAETREPETRSLLQQERLSRLEQRPAVEGCVDMVHRNWLKFKTNSSN